MSNRLRELRKEKQLSLRKLGEKLNISYSNIAMIERGERNFTADTVAIFANFFNVSSDYLLGLSDVRENVAINNFTEHLEGIDFEIIEDIKSLDDNAKQDLKTILKYLKNKGDIKNDT